jgi:hypothetical protein
MAIDFTYFIMLNFHFTVVLHGKFSKHNR